MLSAPACVHDADLYPGVHAAPAALQSPAAFESVPPAQAVFSVKVIQRFTRSFWMEELTKLNEEQTKPKLNQSKRL